MEKAEKNGAALRRWFTYMVRCRDGSLYTGFTVDDVKRRISRHNAGKGARYTASRRPVTLVWHKEWPTEHDARSAEVKIKRLSRAEKEALIQEESSHVQKPTFEAKEILYRNSRG